jgi:ankyrin repeat protein
VARQLTLTVQTGEPKLTNNQSGEREVMKNSRLSVIAFWLLVPVVAFVVIVKIFHLYPSRYIFQWIFLLPYISVILSIAALFHRHTKRTLAIVNLVFCLAAYAPIGIPKVLNSINNNFNLNIPVNKYGTTPLHKAAQYGDIAKVKRILKKNVDVNIKTSNGYTPLMFAAQSGNVKLVEYLILKGADPSIQNKYGQTALTNAVIKNHIKVVQKLIESGADPNSRSATYASPLEISCYQGFTEVFNLLINNGADFKQIHKDHSTLLYRVGNFEIAKKLIELGVNPNTTNDHGDTPFHWWSVKYDIASLLIKSGANVNAKNKYGDTPLHKAGNIETILKLGSDQGILLFY